MGSGHSGLGPSRGIVVRLAALFCVDSFAGGFAVQSLLALWLFERFDLSLAEAGLFFFWSGVLSAFSFPVAAWLATRIAELNISPGRIVVDPGIGFGTTRPQDAAILGHLAPLVSLGFPLLIGLSRKRIVHTLHPDMPPDLASAQMAADAWRHGASILRLHDLRSWPIIFSP